MQKERSRGWCLTLNTYDDDDIAYVTDIDLLGYRYIIIGFEIGNNTYREHLQSYVYFENAKSFSKMQKLFSGFHIESQRGTLDQAVNYCKKDGDYYEIGNVPHQGLMNADRIHQIMANPYENFHLYNQYRRAYADLKSDRPKDHERFIYLFHPDVFLHFCKKFKNTDVCFNEDAYNGERVLVVETFGSSSDLSRWKAGYPRTCRRGYQTIYIDPQYIVYCSPQENGSVEYDDAKKMILFKHCERIYCRFYDDSFSTIDSVNSININ